MINSYIIQLVKNKIIVREYRDGSLHFLKNRGEKEQIYNEAKFWSWFKQKIEYNDEELSFIVVTDNKEFRIPTSCQIKLHQTNVLDNDSYINNEIASISHALFVLSFPKRDTLSCASKTTQKVEEQEMQKEEPLGENALVDYFRKQTQGYKDE